MRTTVDLPEELHRLALDIARDEGKSLSQTVADLVRRGLDLRARPAIRTDQTNGLRLVRLGVPTTSEDVRSLDDDE